MNCRLLTYETSVLPLNYPAIFNLIELSEIINWQFQILVGLKGNAPLFLAYQASAFTFRRQPILVRELRFELRLIGWKPIVLGR